ncbi:kinase-like protein [Obba rivulosa]|uniref:Kinase-like protein n=1 Tax=Obba rivulosa TaxID=1052685 RepID=A0A8E2DNC8_9APHY|nr:kinase-like protein [Obba rivulosa]
MCMLCRRCIHLFFVAALRMETRHDSSPVPHSASSRTKDVVGIFQRIFGLTTGSHRGNAAVRVRRSPLSLGTDHLESKGHHRTCRWGISRLKTGEHGSAELQSGTLILANLLNFNQRRKSGFHTNLRQVVGYYSIEDQVYLQQLLDDWGDESSRELNLFCFDAWRRLCNTDTGNPESYAHVPRSVNLKQCKPAWPGSSGGYADACRSQCGGRIVAVKLCRNYGDMGSVVLKNLYSEAVIWKHLRHPNIARFYGIDTNELDLFLVLEWMPNGVITSFLKRYPSANRLRLIADAAEGLYFLHQMGIIHGDVKGSNIIINNHHTACLVDFGLATLRYNNDLKLGSLGKGSLRHMAPEFTDPESFGLPKAVLSRATDVFSFAMTMWEIFTGKVPFPDRPQHMVVLSVSRGERPDRPLVPTASWLSDDIWVIMQQCWQADRQQRPGIDEVIKCINKALTELPARGQDTVTKSHSCQMKIPWL